MDFCGNSVEECVFVVVTLSASLSDLLVVSLEIELLHLHPVHALIGCSQIIAIHNSNKAQG
jgi:hypothetical protein